VSIRDRAKLKKFIEASFRKEKKKLQSLNFIFCTDQDLLEINQEYLRHNYYTDIITFELSEKDRPVEGEVYISVDRVKENSQGLNEPNYKELHRVIFHGVLHLCGYKDKKLEEKKRMREKEEELLSSYLK
jgi:probable rRNA maturation factor